MLGKSSQRHAAVVSPCESLAYGLIFLKIIPLQSIHLLLFVDPLIKDI